MKIKNWMKQIEKRQAAIAAERDKLDDAIAEMEGLHEACTEAWYLLDEARDCLSKIV